MERSFLASRFMKSERASESRGIQVKQRRRFGNSRRSAITATTAQSSDGKGGLARKATARAQSDPSEHEGSSNFRFTDCSDHSGCRTHERPNRSHWEPPIRDRGCWQHPRSRMSAEHEHEGRVRRCFNFYTVQH